MKKSLITLLLIPLALNLLAQTNEKMEQIRARKVAYITEQLQLTPTEAEHFWPLYNEFSAKLMEYRAFCHKAEQTLATNATEADYAAANATMVDAWKQTALLQEEYYKKFKAILSEEKIHRLYVAERGFRKVILSDIKKK